MQKQERKKYGWLKRRKILIIHFTVVGGHGCGIAHGEKTNGARRIALMKIIFFSPSSHLGNEKQNRRCFGESTYPSEICEKGETKKTTLNRSLIKDFEMLSQQKPGTVCAKRVGARVEIIFENSSEIAINSVIRIQNI